MGLENPRGLRKGSSRLFLREIPELFLTVEGGEPLPATAAEAPGATRPHTLKSLQRKFLYYEEFCATVIQSQIFFVIQRKVFVIQRKIFVNTKKNLCNTRKFPVYYGCTEFFVLYEKNLCRRLRV